MSDEPESQYCQKNEEPVFFKYLRDTGSLHKAMILSEEWINAHGGTVGAVCTNNYHEAELEKERLEYRIKVYNLNRDDFKESLDYYDELIESLKEEEEGKEEEFTQQDLQYKVNYFARNYEYTDLRYDDPRFFEKLDERQAKRLRTAFGKLIPDLDYNDPKVTVVLTRRLWKKLKKGVISKDELLDFLEKDENEAFRLMDERPDAREEPECVICTNNYHEAELERDELERQIKAYKLNREEFKETFEYYNDLIRRGKFKEKFGVGYYEAFPEEKPEFKPYGSVAAKVDDEGLDYSDPYVVKKIEERMAKKKKEKNRGGSPKAKWNEERSSQGSAGCGATGNTGE